MNKMSPIYIDQCPVCDQGTIIAVKNTKLNQFLLMCDDCDAQWLEPQLLKNGGFGALPPDKEIKNVVPMTYEEIIEIGWDKYIEKPFN